MTSKRKEKKSRQFKCRSGGDEIEKKTRNKRSVESDEKAERKEKKKREKKRRRKIKRRRGMSLFLLSSSSG